MADEHKAIREAPTGFGGLLRNIGPGVIVSGSVVGSGELLVTTRMGAEVGFVFLWGVILACLIKYAIQLELGRQCILRNSTTIEILDRVPGQRIKGVSWIAWLCVAGYFSVTVAVIGILGSVAGLMVTIFPFLPEQIWAVVVFMGMSVLLWRGLYNDLETMVAALVATFSLVVIGSVLALQGTDYAISGAQIAAGFGFEMPSEGAFVALALMGSVGATAVELFMYPYWIVEKGYPSFVGPRQDSDEWRARYRGWMRVMMADAGVCTGIALVITCAYYLLGASVLNTLNVLPEGMKVVEQVSLIFTKSIGGDWAYYIFMFGGFCTLFSTLLVFAASSGRIGADFLRRVGVRALSADDGYRRWVRIFQIGFPFLWLVFILFDSRTLDFVLKGANANNLLLIPVAYGVLHLAMKTPGRERMSMWTELALLFTLWAIINFTAINIFNLLGH
ncbi:MAG: Nramp family divalent metal transporter [Candidatus Latescibacteria bacterium]|nr:Nramp family divalent metal transporter [Candidatus Latescibacterota bacterium]